MQIKRNSSYLLSYFLGIFISIFGLSPAVSISIGIDNYYAYYSSMVLILISGIGVIFKTEKIYTSRGGVPLICLWIFLFIMFLHSTSFDNAGQWEALFSVFLCSVCVHLAMNAERNLILKGLINGVIITGILAAFHVIFDPNYMSARSGENFSGADLHYLIIASPISAAIGPILVYMKNTFGIKRFILTISAVIIFVGVLFVMARAAFLLALISAILGISYSKIELKKSKLLIAIISLLTLLSFTGASLDSLADVNQGLGRRFERMLDLNNELEVGGRGSAWAKALELFVERPFWGWNVQGVEARNGVHAHNAILEASGDLGFLGGGAVAIIFVAFFLSFARTIMHSNSVDSFAAHLIGFVLAVESLKSNTVYLSRTTIIFLILVPVLSNANYKTKNRNHYTESKI